jgi:enoyl-CoA hydratase
VTVHVERLGAVTTVVIDRPRSAECHRPAHGAGTRRCLRQFDADPAQHVAVLCGANGHFCAGADLKAFVANPGEWSLSEDGDAPLGPTRMLLSKTGDRGGLRLRRGPAGWKLALWCDLRVVEQTASFGVFCRRWGVPLIDGGTIRLSRLIGHSRALDMMLTGRAVGAEEALAFGLANRVVPAGKARAAAEELAAQVAAFPQTLPAPRPPVELRAMGPARSARR